MKEIFQSDQIDINQFKGQILMLFIGILFLAFSSMQSCWAQTGFGIYNNEPKTRVRFMERNNLVIVPVTINNQITLRFVLDSGVRGIILTEKYYAKLLNLEFDRNLIIRAPGSTDSIAARVVNDVEISLPAIPEEIIQTTGEDFNLDIGHTFDLTNVQIASPAISAKKQSLTVLEEDYLKLTESLGVEVYGIIGYPLFRQFAIEIDHGNKVVTFHNPNTFIAPSYMDRVPLEVINSKPYANTNITSTNGQQLKAKLLVDLGASHALLLDEQSSGNLNKPEITLRGTIGHGLGGEIKGDIGRIKDFGLGPYKCNNVLASFPDSAYYQGNIELVDRNGTIGGEILSRFNVIFNYLDSTLYLTKGVKFKNPFEHNMSGMEYRLIGQELDRLLVINVKEDSPAGQAGIQMGDQIIKINRHKVGSSTFSHIGNLLRSKEGKKMNVKLIRGLQLIDTSFKLERQI